MLHFIDFNPPYNIIKLLFSLGSNFNEESKLKLKNKSITLTVRFLLSRGVIIIIEKNLVPLSYHFKCPEHLMQLRRDPQLAPPLSNFEKKKVIDALGHRPEFLKASGPLNLERRRGGRGVGSKGLNWRCQ